MEGFIEVILQEGLIFTITFFKKVTILDKIYSHLQHIQNLKIWI